MYFRRYTKNEERWYFSGYSIITESIAKKLRWNTDNKLKPKLLWRYGYNQYKAGKYDQAIITFERIESFFKENPTFLSSSSSTSSCFPLSQFYQYWARCYLYLFLQNTQEISFIEKSYEYYHKSSQKIRKIESVIRIPMLLLETGRCLELYGSYEMAMDCYGKILSNYPNFRGYFVALFRTAVVGRHLASIATDAQTKQDTVDKCIDILLFLLESPPPQIPDITLIFLYARTLELSNDNQIKFRAISVYHSLYLCCKNHKYAFPIGNTTTTTVVGKTTKPDNSTAIVEEKVWLTNPNTWLELTNLIEEMNELLIARESFQKYIEEFLKNLPKTTFGNDLSSLLSIDTCLQIAKRYLKYSNLTEAIKYAEYGLKINHYHLETRKFLSKYSEIYQTMFQKERHAVGLLRGLWKYRVWTMNFIKKLKEKTIEELEQQFQKQHFNLQIREQLSYYCKDKYRALFAFEEQCAMKLQHWWQRQLLKFHRQQMIRKRINLLASEILHNYLSNPKDHPNNSKLRFEIIRLSQHRFIGPKHPLHQTAKQILLQNHAIASMVRAIKSYKLRKEIQRLMYERRQRKWLLSLRKIIKIQTRMRMVLSKKRVLRYKLTKIQERIAAKKIQHCWRIYQTTATRVRAMKKLQAAKVRARYIIRKKLLPRLRFFLQTRKEKSLLQQQKQSKRLQRVKDVKLSQHILLAAMTIQRLFRYHFEKSWIYLSRQLIQNRIRVGYSKALTELIETVKEKDCHNQEDLYFYHNPGVMMKSDEFRSLLFQKMVICPHETMDVMDYQLLGTVLAQTICKIQILVLVDCKLFGQLVKPSNPQQQRQEQQKPEQIDTKNLPTVNIALAFPSTPGPASLSNIIPSPPRSASPSAPLKPSKLKKLQNPNSAENKKEAALRIAAANHYFEICKQFFQQIKQCLSIKTLVIQGGDWSADGINYLFRLIQIHNPRIQNFYLEKLPDRRLHSAIAFGASKLLKDYFNYSIPGIRILSLHGCSLRDEDISIISEGLLVNSSLEKLILSLNLITDEGVISLLHALQKNTKHVIQWIDFQYNFIRCQTFLRRQFSTYRLHSLKYMLEIDCRYNPILDGFDPIEYSVQTKLPPQLILHYDPVALRKQFQDRQKLMKSYQDELQKPSARRQLLSVAKGLPNNVVPSTSSHSNTTTASASAEGKEKNHGHLFSSQSYYTSSDANIIYYQTEHFLEQLEERVDTANHYYRDHGGSSSLRSATAATMHNTSASSSSQSISRQGKRRKKGGGGVILPPILSHSNSLNLDAYESTVKIPPKTASAIPLRSKQPTNNDEILLSKTFANLPLKNRYKLPY